MDVCPRFSVFVLSCVGRGLASGWSPVQGVLPKCPNRLISSEVKLLNRNRPLAYTLKDDDDDDDDDLIQYDVAVVFLGHAAVLQR
jgi:hypothetical protein